jgi:hypothetical protein
MGQLPWHDQAIISDQRFACRLDSSLPVHCQWQFGGAGVSAID